MQEQVVEALKKEIKTRSESLAELKSRARLVESEVEKLKAALNVVAPEVTFSDLDQEHSEFIVDSPGWQDAIKLRLADDKQHSYQELVGVAQERTSVHPKTVNLWLNNQAKSGTTIVRVGRGVFRLGRGDAP